MRKTMSHEDSSIVWSPDFVLTREHFQGEPDPNDLHDANTRSQLNYFFKHKIERIESDYKILILDIFVKSYLSPKNSWLRTEGLNETNLPLLLKHELGHFDIAEKHAREFDRKMKNNFNHKSFVFKTETQEETIVEMRKIMQKYFEKLIKVLPIAHKQYDEITNHGTITSEQEKYDHRFETLRNETV